MVFIAVVMGTLGVLDGFVLVTVIHDLGFSDWLVDVLGPAMLAGGALMLWLALFALRGVAGRPGLIVDADGVTDQSSAFPLGRIRWADIESIHWAWPSTRYAPNQYVAIKQQAEAGRPATGIRRFWENPFRGRGINPGVLMVSNDELAHLFRSYSGGRLEISDS